jgi:hypothetical protein
MLNSWHGPPPTPTKSYPRLQLRNTTRRYKLRLRTPPRTRIPEPKHNYFYAVSMPQAQPELKKVSPPRQRKLPLPNLHKYLEKRVLVQLNGSRKVMGILRGYDVRFSDFINYRRISDYIIGLLEHRPRRGARREGRR